MIRQQIIRKRGILQKKELKSQTDRGEYMFIFNLKPHLNLFKQKLKTQQQQMMSVKCYLTL